MLCELTLVFKATCVWRNARWLSQGMKTAVSIPNDIFDRAERLARRTRRSRSRLFTDALREYLARQAPEKNYRGHGSRVGRDWGSQRRNRVSCGRAHPSPKRVVICQGEIWWADLPASTGSGPGFRRPVVVVQRDALN